MWPLDHQKLTEQKMAKFRHLSKEKMEHITNRLWELECSLEGLGALFQGARTDRDGSSFDTDELFGMGQLFKGLSKQVSVLEDILKCGYDSRAITKDSIVKEIAKKKLEAGDCIEGGLDNFEGEGEE